MAITGYAVGVELCQIHENYGNLAVARYAPKLLDLDEDLPAEKNPHQTCFMYRRLKASDSLTETISKEAAIAIFRRFHMLLYAFSPTSLPFSECTSQYRHKV
jgi:hypothetical protein